MEIGISFWKREPYVKMSLEEYRELAGAKDEQEAPIRSNMPKVELLKDGKGEVYAYRVGGVTSTQPPTMINRLSGTVMW